MELRTFKLTLSTFSNISNSTGGTNTDAPLYEGPYQAVEVVIIVLITGSISIVTITGNILVILSISMNRNLQTINNYFIFSLASADLIIGVSSMNLYTVDIVIGYWPLGQVVCQIWLLLDYVACVTSVTNLLIISFDRYFCVTKPLSYPARRTTRIAGLMIAAAWLISFIIWAPPILSWQFIVEDDQCSLRFLYDASVTFITSTAFFYLPVTIMTFLYWRISRASKSRVKTGKRVPKQDNPSSSKAVEHTTMPCDDDYVKTHCPEKNWSGGTGDVGEEESSAPVHPERNEIAETPAGYQGNPTAHSLNASMLKQRPERKAPPSREKKVTRMITMILVAFIVTWTPYQVMKVISTFCSTCVPTSLWRFGFWLCYTNSTINPACYALCNVTFKKTFKQLLLCQYKDIRLGKYSSTTLRTPRQPNSHCQCTATPHTTSSAPLNDFDELLSEFVEDVLDGEMELELDPAMNEDDLLLQLLVMIDS